MVARRLSKTNIISGLQCLKRLYLEVHNPELAEVSDETEQRLAMGNDVGQVARDLHPGGILIETGGDLARALQETRDSLSGKKKTTLFEATFEHEGVLVKTDILQCRPGSRQLVEVKASASVKPYHAPDVAVQYWVLKGAGYEPDKATLAHINSSFVYPGNGNYKRLFTKADMTDEIRKLQRQVPKWVKSCKSVLEGTLPSVEAGDQCHDPFDCPFINHCMAGTIEPEFPVTLLPRGGAATEKLLEMGIKDLRQAREDHLSNPLHRKIWRATISGEPIVDAFASREILKHAYPRYYLDFETIAFAIPVWAGTKPYMQIPFQWSCHVEHQDGSVEHNEFLDTSGDLPIRALAESLIAAVGTQGSIYAYSAFESTVLNRLSEMLPDLAAKLQKVRARIVDLLTITRRAYYHPAMKGSWSIKAVLPTIASGLRYDTLDVQNGGMAQEAYLEAIHPGTSKKKYKAIRKNLLEYCGRDTEGLIEITRFFERTPPTQSLE